MDVSMLPSCGDSEHSLNELLLVTNPSKIQVTVGFLVNVRFFYPSLETRHTCGKDISPNASDDCIRQEGD